MNTRCLVRILPLLALALGACEGLLGSDDEGVPDADLIFVPVSADAPPLEETVVSFWIKRGEAREVQIRYVYARPNGTTSYGKCLRLLVPADAPLRYPDGRAFAVGDSALVTIRVADPSEFRFEFEPAGLRFNPDVPAELEVKYSYADADLNQDGVVDAKDRRIAEKIQIWHQRRPGARWTEISTVRLDDVVEAHASITGFSQYALASN